MTEADKWVEAQWDLCRAEYQRLLKRDKRHQKAAYIFFAVASVETVILFVLVVGWWVAS